MITFHKRAAYKNKCVDLFYNRVRILLRNSAIGMLYKL
jgi:hypothetical protein